eukprot:GHVS01081294.1.p1 GENE.GHVS01081294.1~~GHVS01081294.1.p1  ORF type:complete len:263 (-),score=34.84 GHVS01081294.1:569-1357(-)
MSGCVGCFSRMMRTSNYSYSGYRLMRRSDCLIKQTNNNFIFSIRRATTTQTPTTQTPTTRATATRATATSSCFYHRLLPSSTRWTTSLQSKTTTFDFEKEMSNVRVITSMSEYDNLVSSAPNLLVFFFSAENSTSSRTIRPKFASLAADFPQVSFFSIDVDAIPRAAYHADVQIVPSIVIMQSDDALRERIQPQNYCETDDLISRCRIAIDKSLSAVVNCSSRRSTRCWYSHNIEIDNLNIYKTGWMGQPDDTIKKAMEKGG